MRTWPTRITTIVTDQSLQHVARADISLAALRHNLARVRNIALGSHVMAVIKANAYGHGALRCAAALDADALAVARLSEAIALRDAGITQTITLLEGVFSPAEAALADQHQLDVVIHQPYQVALVEGVPGIDCWLKLNTGMNRLGLDVAGYQEARSRIPRARIRGLMSHFSHADDITSAVTAEQLQRFDNLSGSSELPVSLCNSAAILAHPAAHRDWVRPGLMLYGTSPLGEDANLRAVMQFSAPVISVAGVKAGETVGYNGLFTAQEDTRIAILAAGYADGYPREVSTDAHVLLNGVRCPLAGRVSMDMMAVSLPATLAVAPGDRAELWGEHLPVARVAAFADTIAYTLLCAVSERVPRIYSD